MSGGGSPDGPFDVAVVGGGSAGVAAAMAAEATGARTVLVERADRLGGNATLAFVHTICGLYRLAREGDAVHAHGWLPRGLAVVLRGNRAAAKPERAGPVWVLPTDPPAMARTLERSLSWRPGLELRLGHRLAAARLGDEGGAGEPHALTVEGPDGATEELRARVVIDASGDATLAAAAGLAVDMEAPERLQIPSYIVRLAGVPLEATKGFARMRLTHAVASAVRAGDLPPGCEAVLLRPGSGRHEAYLTVNVPKLEGRSYDPLDDGYRAELERAGRDAAERVVAFLAERREGFSNARIAEHPTRIGIRETRRVRGRATLTREDILAGRARDDAVALSSWPIELWHEHRSFELELPSGAAGIPLGALVAEGHDRVGVAGRCMSATHEALGALRVIGTALATGQAIGHAAALAAKRGGSLADVDPADVRRHIHGSGSS